jgi:D-sedoheptulose 7-phosphate isomerase
VNIYKLQADLQDKILTHLNESAQVLQQVGQRLTPQIEQAAQLLIHSLKSGGKILLCGNGGSAADAQHLATELVVRLNQERAAIPAIALTVNTSILTAVSNDYQFELVFVRQLEALGKPGDILIAISTSGNSGNVIKAVEYARAAGLTSIGLTGGAGGRLVQKVDLALVVPSQSVQRIQEAHITIGHILCELVEEALSCRD